MWTWFWRVGPFAGAADGPPSPFGPSGRSTMMKRWKVPFESPSESRLAALRKKSVT